MPFYTIGHSTRSIDELVALLQAAPGRAPSDDSVPGGVVVVADVRTVPRSRANPQFEGPALARALADYGIGYEHVAALGGLRPRQRDVPDEINGLWNNRSFHNYADYALGDSFAAGLERLCALGRHGHCVIMCAEAVWWRCHRRIIADHLLQRGEHVHHILGPGKVQPASLTPGARVDRAGRLTYPRLAT